MTVPRSFFRPLRILLSEGSSTSAREAITVLGLAGHTIEICDPAAFPLTLFSRFPRKVHRCPPMRDDPLGFLAFVEQLVARERFDVLLPIHEQGYLFARFQQRFARVGLALPAFESYRTLHSKVGFHRVLDQLGLPQPATTIVREADGLRAAARLPCVIKTAIGTASRGVWMVRDAAGFDRALRELTSGEGFADDVLVQALAEGFTEKAQGVFGGGVLLGFHAYRQIAEGAGGGDARKCSVRREGVRADLARIGRHLNWHGALSVDYIWSEAGPVYIDANPRLVEPMAAFLAGNDLVDLLLRISTGETPAPLPDGRDGVLTHQAMQALLGCAQRGGTRREVLRESFDLFRHRGVYAGSTEELTPVRQDPWSLLPLAITTLALLVSPRLAKPLATRGWGQHLLSPRTVRLIEG
ncbi:hypothetical protein [Tardiphaga sp.]|uniref:hypothetical protein n=1 Tax=Tardiphaga sp. TaxID=1926292 RepID=UPI00262D8543|nr:hypothetical protein [Tardiphaga sp.]MDB5617373.1 hypothetical protein [Tardiphaga sp.]